MFSSPGGLVLGAHYTNLEYQGQEVVHVPPDGKGFDSIGLAVNVEDQMRGEVTQGARSETPVTLSRCYPPVWEDGAVYFGMVPGQPPYLASLVGLDDLAAVDLRGGEPASHRGGGVEHHEEVEVQDLAVGPASTSSCEKR